MNFDYGEKPGFLSHMMSQEIVQEGGEKFDMSFLDLFSYEDFLLHIDSKTEAEVDNFFRYNLEYVANKVLSSEEHPISLLRTSKAIVPMCRLINSLPESQISQLVKTFMCDLTYIASANGLNIPWDDEDAIKSNLYDTVFNLYKPYCVALMNQCRYVRNAAVYICCCRFGSFNEEINICRLNFCICSSVEFAGVSVQEIVWIYEKLFDHFGLLFKTSMFDWYSPKEEREFGPDFSENYSAISLALLEILKNMTFNQIRHIVMDYVETWERKGRPPVRFSLCAISGDFERVRIITEEFSKKGIYIP